MLLQPNEAGKSDLKSCRQEARCSLKAISIVMQDQFPSSVLNKALGLIGLPVSLCLT